MRRYAHCTRGKDGLFAHGLFGEKGNDPKPVSYTHLDVYKRQIHALREEGDPALSADKAYSLYFYPRPP